MVLAFSTPASSAKLNSSVGDFSLRSWSFICLIMSCMGNSRGPALALGDLNDLGGGRGAGKRWETYPFVGRGFAAPHFNTAPRAPGHRRAPDRQIKALGTLQHSRALAKREICTAMRMSNVFRDLDSRLPAANSGACLARSRTGVA